MGLFYLIQKLDNLIVYAVQSHSKLVHSIGKNALIGQGETTVGIQPYDMGFDQIPEIRVLAQGINQLKWNRTTILHEIYFVRATVTKKYQMS
jgi:hypothetical protein